MPHQSPWLTSCSSHHLNNALQTWWPGILTSQVSRIWFRAEELKIASAAKSHLKSRIVCFVHEFVAQSWLTITGSWSILTRSTSSLPFCIMIGFDVKSRKGKRREGENYTKISVDFSVLHFFDLSSGSTAKHRPLHCSSRLQITPLGLLYFNLF